MRQIKFRGKALTGGEWVYGYFVPSDDDGDTYIISPIITPVIGNEIGLTPVAPDTVGQFIGLQDMHGKELYEGDIVKVFDSQLQVSFKGVIKFGDASFYIDDLEGTTHWRWQDYEVEVMGNIFDSPELLEVTD